MKELDLIGKSLEQVEKALQEAQVDYRIVRINNDHYIVTHDFKPERANLEFEDGLLKKLTWG